MKTRNFISSFLREIAVVVIGVLVALFINNWNEEAKRQRFLKKALFAIGEEIKTSKTDMEEVLEKHIWLIDSIAVNYNNDEESIRQIFIRYGGLQISEVKNIGLRFFITYNAELVDYELISDLSEIEFASKGFQLKMDKLMDFGYDNMSSKKSEDKMKIAQILDEVTDSEKSMLKLYEGFLVKYESQLKLNQKSK